MKNERDLKVVPACIKNYIPNYTQTYIPPYMRPSYNNSEDPMIKIKNSKSTFAWLVAISIVLALLAWIMAPKSVHADVVDKIVAVVNKDIITESDLTKAMRQKDKLLPKLKINSKGPKTNEEVKQNVLDQLIDEAIFNQLLEKSKIEVSDEDLAKAIANILHQNRITIDQLKNELASKGMSYEDYKKEIVKNIKRIKFVSQVIGPQVKITDQDIRDYYEKNQDKLRTGNEVRIAEIVLSLEGVRTQEDFDKLGELAVSIVTKARGGQSFETLAKQYSKGPNADKGGDLGNMNLKDFPMEVREVVKTMKVGDVSHPILAGPAVVIVKLISVPGSKSGNYEKARDEIYNAIYDQRIEETLAYYLANERKKAFVEIR